MYYDHIIVPLDGSAFAESAVPYALGLAERAGSRLELVRVHQETPPAGYIEYVATEAGDWLGRVEADARAYLESVADRIGTRAEGRLTITLLTGRPGNAIEEHLRDSRAGMLVMATHGHGPLTRAWLGSVADQLVRSALAPILLVRPDEKGAREVGSVRSFAHILVPLDGSTLAEEALTVALPLGALLGAEFTLLRAVPLQVHIGSPHLAASLALDTAVMEGARTAAIGYLQEVAARVRARDTRVQAVVRDGAPARVILGYAAEHGVDLIAITTRGQGGLERLVIGSIADKVIRGSDRPVLVFAPPDADQRR